MNEYFYFQYRIQYMGNKKISGVIAFEDGTVFREKGFGAIVTQLASVVLILA